VVVIPHVASEFESCSTTVLHGRQQSALDDRKLLFAGASDSRTTEHLRVHKVWRVNNSQRAEQIMSVTHASHCAIGGEELKMRMHLESKHKSVNDFWLYLYTTYIHESRQIYRLPIWIPVLSVSWMKHKV
jgi:hypothetical protein